jgi:hypothetical protein
LLDVNASRILPNLETDTVAIEKNGPSLRNSLFDVCANEPLGGIDSALKVKKTAPINSHPKRS